MSFTDSASAAEGPWTKYQKKQPTAAPAATAAPEGPWTKYQKPGYTPPPPPPSTTADVAKSFGAGAVQGTTGLAKIPEAIRRGVDYAVKLPGYLAGMTDEDFAKREAEVKRRQQESIFGRLRSYTDPGEAAKGLARGADVASRALGGEYQPQTKAGQVAKEVGTYAPGLALPGVGLTSRVAEGVAGRVVGQGVGRAVENVALPAIGGQVGEKLGEQVGHPELGRFAGSIIGGGLGGIKGPRIDPTSEAAARAAGVSLPLAAATTTRGIPMIAQATEHLPVVGAPLEAAAEKSLQGIRDVKSGAETAAGATSRLASGTKVKDRITSWVDGTSNKNVSEAYDKADAINMRNPNMTHSLDNLHAAVGDITSRRIASKAIDENGPAVNQVSEAIKQPMTLQGIKDLRTRIGQMTKGKLLPPDYNKAEFEQIYSALSRDYEAAAAKAGGPQGAAALKRADQMALATQNRRKALEPLVGATGKAAPEAVFDNVQRLASAGGGGNVQTLARAKRVVGTPDWEEFAGTVGSRLGRDPKTGETSLAGFSTNYGRMSPEGKDILFGKPGSKLRDSYDQIAALGTREAQLRKYSNLSGTGKTAGTLGGLAGLWFEPTATAGAAVAGHLLSHILASDVTAKPFSRLVRASQDDTWARSLGASPTGLGKAAVATSAALRNLTNTVNSQYGTDYTPDQLMHELQGGQGSGQSGSTAQSGSTHEPFRVQVPYHIRPTP